MKLVALTLLILGIPGASGFGAELPVKKRKARGHWENGHYITEARELKATKPVVPMKPQVDIEADKSANSKESNPYGALDYGLRDKQKPTEKRVRVIVPSPYENSEVPGSGSSAR